MNPYQKMTRNELVKWINSTLLMNIQSIEKIYNGAIFCQLMHMLYPDSIPMVKVNFLAQDPFESQKNYRLLQAAFSKKKIPFNLDIDKLSKGRPQDNLELIQYMRNLFDRTYDNHPYDAPASRSQSKGGKSMNYTLQDLEVMENERAMNSASSMNSTPRASGPEPNSYTATAVPTLPQHLPRRPTGMRTHVDSSSELETLRSRVKELEHTVLEREKMIESLSKEGTSMYYTMRKVESYLLDLQEKGETVVGVDSILNIMYNSFVTDHPPEEETWKDLDLSINHVEDSFENIEN